jgi:hypothetical protein
VPHPVVSAIDSDNKPQKGCSVPGYDAMCNDPNGQLRRSLDELLAMMVILMYASLLSFL